MLHEIINVPNRHIALQVSERRGSYLAFFIYGGNVTNRLNLHIDETGNQDLSEGIYLVAVVLHDHVADIATPIEQYRKRLAESALDDIPFHGKDLLHGNEAYRSVSPGDRKRLLAQFSRLVRTLPFSYFSLRYDASDTHSKIELESKIRRGFGRTRFRSSRFLPRVRYDFRLLRRRPKRSQRRPARCARLRSG